jgi:hypothetical protein
MFMLAARAKLFIHKCSCVLKGSSLDSHQSRTRTIIKNHMLRTIWVGCSCGRDFV